MIGCEVEDGDLLPRQKLENLEGPARVTPSLQGLSLTVRDLGVPEQPRVRFSILPTTRSGRYLLLPPNGLPTGEEIKLIFR